MIPVLRRHVLAALAAGVEAGDDEAARDVLRSTDWVLRAPARRELSRALIDAALLSGELGIADREAVRHIHRVAALNVAKRYEVDVGNRDDVAAAYATLTTPPAPRAPVATIAAGITLALGVLLLVWLTLMVRTPARPVRPTPPLPAGAFFYGGTPARDSALEQYVVAELTDLVIETDAERRGSSEGAPRAKHAAELRESPVIARRGAALASAWRGMIDALDHWTDARSKTFRSYSSELGRRTQAVSDQLAALGLGIYLQSDVLLDNGIAHAAIFVFAVENVGFVRAGGQPRRVLDLRRLDELNLRHTLLGRQNEEHGDPVVLLDQVDELVRERVMPVLGGFAYPLGDDAWRSSRFGGGTAAIAGDAIRRELETALGTVPANVQAVAPQVSRIIAASVRRHEARHGIDNDRETPLRYPDALAAYVPNDAGELAQRSRAELAAYLSQIGNEPVVPQFALWNIASLAFNRARAGSPESYAGAIIIEGLARQLGFGSARPAIVNGQFERQRLAALAEPLAAQSGDKLRLAARRLWLELYGEPMLPIVDLLR